MRPADRRRLIPGVRAVLLTAALVAGCGSVRPAGPVPTRDNPTTASPPTTSAVASPSSSVADGSPSVSPTSSGTPSGRSSSTPSPSAARTSAPSATRPVIVIDPGHSGRSIRSRTVNQLLDFDYPNQPEMTEVFDVSSCVATGLRGDGYRVVLTKKHESSSVSLTERARIADRVHAALAISVHDDHSQGAGFQAVYSQLGLVHGGRHIAMYRGSGSHRTVFALPSVARASDRAARRIATARARAEGRPVRLAEENFTGRPPLEPGNLALVQLLTHRPWVYNEMGALAGGSTTRELSVSAESRYAKGLLDGVEAAVPLPGDHTTTSTAQLRSCLAARR